MKNYKVLGSIAALFILSACDVDKVDEGSLPDVNVSSGNLPEYEIKKTKEGEMPSISVEGGDLPNYDIDTADVKIGTEKKEITVPTVDIDLPEDEENIEAE